MWRDADLSSGAQKDMDPRRDHHARGGGRAVLLALDVYKRQGEVRAVVDDERAARRLGYGRRRLLDGVGLSGERCLGEEEDVYKRQLLDEPTNALDPINAARAIRIFEQMVKNGTSILVSSHLLGTIDSLCDSVIFFSGGGLVEVDSGGDASSVFEKCYGPLSGTIS